MKPEQAGKTAAIGPLRHVTPRRPAQGLSPRDLADIEALTSASETFQRMDRPPRPPRRGSWPIALMCAVLVGGGLVWVEGFEYECSAVIVSHTPSDADAAQQLGVRFRGHVARRIAESTDDALVPDAWRVDLAPGGRLRLTIQTADKSRGRDFVQESATGFVQQLSESRAAARSRPGEAEQVVAAYVERLQHRLTTFHAQAEQAEASTPDTDPRPARKQQLDQWQASRDRFQEIQSTLSSANETLRRLEAAPPPSHGIVTAEQRRRAVEADEPLTQDLAELDVQLGEIKVHVLAVAQEVAERLAALSAATQTLADALPHKPVDEPPDTERSTTDWPWGDLPALVKQYRESIVAFRGAFEPWSVKLRQWTCDPRSARVIDMHQEGSTLLAEFMHRSGRLLAAMRDQLRITGEKISDTARHHVRHSDLVRGLAELRRAHDRFGFAADQIKPTLNFHIDAPLRSARGLRKRTRLQIEHIERTLETKARARARERHAQRIQRTRRLIETTRGQLDENVAAILELQADLNLSSETSEAFLEAVLQHQFANDLARAARDDMIEMKTRLDELRARRTEKWTDLDLEVRTATVADSPVNLYPRLRTGALAALATLLAVGLVQWWAGRR